MKTQITLRLVRCDDPGLDCIVCRGMRVDRAVAYRTKDGQAWQGIHSQCVARAELTRVNRKLRRSGIITVNTLMRDLEASQSSGKGGA